MTLRNTEPGTIFIQSADNEGDPRWLRFSNPVRTICTEEPDGVSSALEKIEQAVDQGLFAAGFVSYEAAPAFDPAFTCHPPDGRPLLWFGLYDSGEDLGTSPAWPREPYAVGEWKAATSKADYVGGVEKIKQYIAAGDTYQVNYTIRSHASFEGCPLSFFSRLVDNQKSRYAAFIDTGDQLICSASPELFFKSDGNRIMCKPMKGTTGRGLSAADDDNRSEALHNSAKDRAENIMIVDMVRNDLGRIADAGSVDVVDLYKVEKYKTLFQMTSTVEARTQADIGEIFHALFPCASVTGAPKVRTMQIIHELEERPRGIYTGAIGLIKPDRSEHFSVAIRTVSIDRATGIAEYGTGSGIVWDSVPESEHAECVTKALVLTADTEPFNLLETILWRPRTGVSLLSHHLERLSSAATYFDFPFDRNAVTEHLEQSTAVLPSQPHRLRLLLDREGHVSIEATPLSEEQTRAVWRVTLADTPVDETDAFLYHKTTKRDVYEQHRNAHPEYDDVILWNKNGEITESTACNLAVLINGEWRTPLIRCGLLAGTFRAALIARGRVKEAVISKDDLRRATRIVLMNSVRGLIPVELV